MLALGIAMAGCGPDQTAWYEIWVSNASAEPAVLVLTSSSRDTHVPNLLSPPSSALLRSGDVTQPASGFSREVLIYDLDCNLVDLVVVSDGDWLVEIGAGGEVSVTPFDAPAAGAAMLSEAGTRCSADPGSSPSSAMVHRMTLTDAE